MSKLLRIAFAALIARPIVYLWLGVNVRHRERLPLRGPAIIAANHNSHLDTFALLSLFPLLQVPKVRPAAAADYFMKGGALSWVAQNLIGIVPVARGSRATDAADTPRADPLEGCYRALEAGNVLIIFPEGTRGEPERMQELKSGIAYLGQRFPEVPVIPLFMYGLGKSMPKGSFVPLPFFVDIFVDQPLTWKVEGQHGKDGFMGHLRDRFQALRRHVIPASLREEVREDPDVDQKG
jgi:1-acyl-sn-glycerol-3-phosphate acyltransferase